MRHSVNRLRASGQKIGLGGILLLGMMVVTACETSVSAPPVTPDLEPVVLDETVAIATGQTLYVPVYSYIFMVEGSRTINLTNTLSIRNTSREDSLIITTVDYHDSEGNLVNQYLDNPVELGPLAATEFVIPQADVQGGIGASFIVEWVAQTAVSDPVIEAIMINTQGNQGLSFISPGRVIETLP